MNQIHVWPRHALSSGPLIQRSKSRKPVARTVVNTALDVKNRVRTICSEDRQGEAPPKCIKPL